jgi:sugar lactone lactonase YvrE
MPRTLLLCILSLVAGPLVAQDMPLSQVLIDGKGWRLVADGYQFTEGPATDRDGNVFFVDVPASKIFRIDVKTGDVTTFAEDTGKASGLMFGRDGKLYACQYEGKKVVWYEADATMHVLAENIGTNDLAVDATGSVYVTDMTANTVWYVSPEGKTSAAAEGFKPNGLTLWPDGGTLVVADWDQPHAWAFRVDGPGKLQFGERYYGPVRIPPDQELPGSDGMTIDDAGRLFLCTHAGLQMFDPTGRPSGVIAKPQAKFLSNVIFGGAAFDTLYVTCSDKVYARKTKTKGTPPPAR